VFDAAHGTPRCELEPHDMGVLQVGWSTGGGHLATSGQDGRLRIYRWEPAPTPDPTPNPDPATPTSLPSPATRSMTATAAIDLDGWGGALAWSPTDELVAVGGGRSVLVCDVHGEVRARWSSLTSTVTDLAWSPDGSRLGAACYGGVSWFRPDAADEPARSMTWKGSLLSLAVAPNGRWVAAGCQDASVHVWKLWSGSDMAMSGYPSKIERLAWHPGSRFMAVGSVGDVTVWDFGGRGPQGSKPEMLDGFERHISALVYRPDGAALAAGDGDGTLRIWSAPKHHRLRTHLAFGEGIAALSWHPRSPRLLVGGAEGTITMLATGD